jgi:hypothetical protein
VFFPTKLIGIIKINFGHYVGKYRSLVLNSPVSCPKTGPLQLGVVLGLINHMICTYTGFIVDAIGVVVLPTL